MSNDPYDYEREEQEATRGYGWVRAAIIIALASLVFWAALGIFIRANAEASPLSYTQVHCVSFARAVQDERWGAAVRQVRYLSRSYTINSVERYADAWLATTSNRALRGLINGCYNAVF